MPKGDDMTARLPPPALAQHIWQMTAPASDRRTLTMAERNLMADVMRWGPASFVRKIRRSWTWDCGVIQSPDTSYPTKRAATAALRRFVDALLDADAQEQQPRQAASVSSGEPGLPVGECEPEGSGGYPSARPMPPMPLLRRKDDPSDDVIGSAIGRRVVEEPPRCHYCRGTVRHFSDCPFLPGPQARGCGFCGRLLGITQAFGVLCGECESAGATAECDPLEVQS